ncbi:MAG: PD40 domain-containing protein [Pyrinomonadaceae bacterium]|nr:PD40 domain-containing protein [Pyrinomonadaceae bacterium]
MSQDCNHFYEFGPFRLCPAENLLTRDGEPVPLAPKLFETLVVLVRHSGHLVMKDELLKAIWPDSFVEEGNLSVNIFALRKALGDVHHEHKYIETVPKRGYRFVAPVREVLDADAHAAVEQHTTAQISVPEGRSNQDGMEQIRLSGATSVARGNGQTVVSLAKEPAVRTDEVKAARPPSASPFETTTPDKSSATARPITNKIERHRHGAALAIAMLVIAVASFAFGLYRFVIQNQPRIKPAASFQTTTFTRLTSTGRATAAAISPDGKYFAYVLDEAGLQSLWMSHIIPASNVEVIPPAEVRYQGLTFSPDGSYIYCVMRKPDGPDAALYRVPALGGAPPKKLLDGVDSPITLSPDGRQIAFVRNYPGQGFGALMVANADGSREQQLAPGKDSDHDRFFFHPGGPTWSPDGKVIACPVGIDSDASYMNVAEVGVTDGAVRPISSQRWWNVGRIAWFSDGSGLVMAAREQQSTWNQIWQVSYPGGETRRITNDLDRYLGVSLSTDSNAMVTVQAEQVSNIWIAPGGKARRAQQTTFGKLNYYNLSWTPDGRVVYQSNASGRSDIWIMGADGKNQKQLTVDGDYNFYPTVSPDGRYVVFSSNRGRDVSVWRMDIDGGNLKQLTDAGSSFQYPSPDGSWVIYTSFNSGKPTLWKVAIDGGEPVQLTDKYSSMPAISPDGKSVACLYRDEPTSPNKIAIVPFEGGQPVRVFDLPTGSGIFRWTPDGGALDYIDTQRGVSNIWGQPVDGGAPQQLTDFTADRIFGFDWSGDGKQLAIARGDVTNDVVLLRGFR